jgi:hypothetical protein
MDELYIFTLNSDILGEMKQCEVGWCKMCLLMGKCETFWLQGISCPHVQGPPILASQKHVALKGLKDKHVYIPTI